MDKLDPPTFYKDEQDTFTSPGYYVPVSIYADLRDRVKTLENKLFLLEQNYATLYKRVNSELGEDTHALNE